MPRSTTFAPRSPLCRRPGRARPAGAYRVEQVRWEQAAVALNDILYSLGNAVRDGADEVAAIDRRAANAWGV